MKKPSTGSASNPAKLGLGRATACPASMSKAQNCARLSCLSAPLSVLIGTASDRNCGHVLESHGGCIFRIFPVYM
jgi:hypothetical protein